MKISEKKKPFFTPCLILQVSPLYPILTTLLQVLTHLIDRKMSLAEAVSTPRFHYQGLPNLVLTEPYAFSSSLVEQLWQRGYRVIPFRPWGAAESILVQGQQSKGVNDPRRSAGEAKRA
ncbi:MAG: hypothetical protein GVY17_02435 [Cyanobacteria bacterium]|nr:hypothetical protein [Cyanobacteria bacterium GSL.Bin21]